MFHHDDLVAAGTAAKMVRKTKKIGVTLTVLKSASFPRPLAGVIKVERSGVGGSIRVSMPRITLK